MQLLKDISGRVHELREDGVETLSRILKEIDVGGKKSMDIDDFRWALLDYGI